MIDCQLPLLTFRQRGARRPGAPRTSSRATRPRRADATRVRGASEAAHPMQQISTPLRLLQLEAATGRLESPGRFRHESTPALHLCKLLTTCAHYHNKHSKSPPHTMGRHRSQRLPLCQRRPGGRKSLRDNYLSSDGADGRRRQPAPPHAGPLN